MKVCNLFEHTVAIRDGVDSLQLVLERLGAGGLDRFFVHPAGVIISDLLHLGRGFRVSLGLGSLRQ